MDLSNFPPSQILHKVILEVKAYTERCTKPSQKKKKKKKKKKKVQLEVGGNPLGLGDQLKTANAK